MPAKWLTMAEYARRHGISREAVRQAVKAGRVEHNGEAGRACRVRGELAEPVRAVSSPAAPTGGEDGRLADVKLEKLRVEVGLQRQRLQENIRESRRRYVELLVEEYVRAFSPFKAQLAELRLTEPQLVKLRKLVDDCLQAFTDGVDKRLREDEADERA